MYAAHKGHDEAIRILVMEAGASLGVTNKVSDSSLLFIPFSLPVCEPLCMLFSFKISRFLLKKASHFSLMLLPHAERRACRSVRRPWLHHTRAPRAPRVRRRRRGLSDQARRTPPALSPGHCSSRSDSGHGDQDRDQNSHRLGKDRQQDVRGVRDTAGPARVSRVQSSAVLQRGVSAGSLARRAQGGVSQEQWRWRKSMSNKDLFDIKHILNMNHFIPK